MVRVRIGAAWTLSCLVATACNPENGHVFLVGRFSDQGGILKTNLSLPPRDDSFHFRSELRQGDLSCALTAKLLDKTPLNASDCAGRKGSGKVSCNDGQKYPLEWTLTSCRSGFGRAVPGSAQPFVFGFNRDPDRAIDQMEKADNVK